MRALVTGATGFLGSHLARLLVERGHRTTVLVRTTSDCSRLSGVDVAYAPGDVTDPTSVSAALSRAFGAGDRAALGASGPDVVFHCAAFVELGARDEGHMHAVNVEGTRNVLAAAASHGVLTVHVSSVAALGPTGPALVDESWWNPTPPVVGYERTKREAHLLARQAAAAGAPVRVGIPGGIYGPGDDSAMAQLIRTFSTRPTPIGYMPELMQSTVNVDDCADGLVRIAERGRDGHEYLLCAEAVTFREWFRLIAAGAGRRPPVAHVPTRVVRASARPAAKVTGWLGGNPGTVVDTVAIATRHQAFSGERMRRELGWQPRPLSRGMAEMATAFQAQRPRRRRR